MIQERKNLPKKIISGSWIIFWRNMKRKMRRRLFCCTAAVHPAAATCWNICPHFFILQYFISIPISLPREEYEKRVLEQQRLIGEMKLPRPVSFLEGAYHPEDFFAMAKGMEELPEKGERCYHCYRLRLRETAQTAAQNGFDYFCTTLSISPMKNARWINEISRELEREYQVKWLSSDFKKKEGYKRSIALSQEYGLYRQNYCGCVFSRRD